MNPAFKVVAVAVMAAALVVVAGVCWHSVEEIHYLKSFYPRTFSVEEAFYASLVELIKVTLISAPLLLFSGAVAGLLALLRKKQ